MLILVLSVLFESVILFSKLHNHFNYPTYILFNVITISEYDNILDIFLVKLLIIQDTQSIDITQSEQSMHLSSLYI